MITRGQHFSARVRIGDGTVKPRFMKWLQCLRCVGLRGVELPRSQSCACLPGI